jgi:hypothetical protein
MDAGESSMYKATVLGISVLCLVAPAATSIPIVPSLGVTPAGVLGAGAIQQGEVDDWTASPTGFACVLTVTAMRVTLTVPAGMDADAVLLRARTVDGIEEASAHAPFPTSVSLDFVSADGCFHGWVVGRTVSSGLAPYVLGQQYR